MTLSYHEWTDPGAELEVIEETVGGDTFIFNGNRLCYAFTKAHHRAIRALLGDVKDDDKRGTDWLDIKDDVVNQLVDDGVVTIDTSDCQPDTGYLGCLVWDADFEFVGTIGERCSLPAGWGTKHNSYGRCKLHGGSGIVERMMNAARTGLSSKHLRAQVANKIDKFIRDPAPLDLTKEIATQRALLEMLMEYVVNRGDIELFMEKVPGLMDLIDSIGNMANRAALIEKRYAMTAAQVLYVQSVFVDIINHYIDSPKVRERIAAELQQRLGSGAREVNLSTQNAYLMDANSEY